MYYYKITGLVQEPHLCDCGYCTEEWEEPAPLVTIAEGESLEPEAAKQVALRSHSAVAVWVGEPSVELVEVPNNGRPVFLMPGRRVRMGEFVTDGFFAICPELVNIVSAIPLDQEDYADVPPEMERPSLGNAPLEKGKLWARHLREYIGDGFAISLEERYVEVFEAAGLSPFSAGRNRVVLLDDNKHARGFVFGFRAEHGQ